MRAVALPSARVLLWQASSISSASREGKSTSREGRCTSREGKSPSRRLWENTRIRRN